MKPGDINLGDLQLTTTYQGPPHLYFETLRKESPVHWNPPIPDRRANFVGDLSKGFWILSKHADVSAASRNPKVFSSYAGGPVIWDPNEATLAQHRSGLMGMDPPDHTRFRKLVTGPFSPANIAAMEPVVQKYATEIVDEVAAAGRCELILDVVSRLPVLMMCHLMGIPIEDRMKIFNWSNQAADLDSEEHDAALAMNNIYQYCMELAAVKRAQPDDSMLSMYANGKVDGEQLSDAEINQFFLTLSIAGHETTRNTAAHFLRLMIEHPDQYQLLMSDLDKYLPNAIEEVLRHSSAVMQFRRTATEDIVVRGVTIGKGDKVLLSYTSANRDEELFPDPHRFDITRANAGRHLAFGMGEHYCLGASFARMQLKCFLTEMLTRFKDLRFETPPQYLRSIWFNALVAMPIAFDAERRAA